MDAQGDASRPWRPLVVAAGDATAEAARSKLFDELGRLGFEPRMWDLNPAIDASTGTDGSCVEALRRHDFVVGLVTAQPGSPVRADDPDRLRPQETAALRRLGVLPPAGSSAPLPTVLQVEILAAKAFGRPLVLFVDHDFSRDAKRAMDEVRRNPSLLEPCVPDAGEAAGLLEARQWRELSFAFQARGEIEGLDFAHVFFLQRVKDEGPGNWVREVSLRLDDVSQLLPRRLQEQLIELPRVLTDEQARRRRSEAGIPGQSGLSRHLQRSRNPLTAASVQELLERTALVDPPYTRDGDHPDEPLWEFLTKALTVGRNVMVLGGPGGGKTTSLLVAAQRLAADQPGVRVLVANCKEIPPDGELLQTLVGLEAGRDPWPLRIPEGRWAVCLDALDEAREADGRMSGMPPWLHDVVRRQDVAVLISCRESDEERRFRPIREHIDDRVVLTPWGAAEINQYVQILEGQGLEGSAQLIRRLQSESREFIELPLWLAMLAYIGQHLPEAEPGSEVEALSICARTFAEQECQRNHVNSDRADELIVAWRQAAWRLTIAGGPIQEPVLWAHLGAPEELREPVCSLFEYLPPDFVTGFFHEVFREYWLGDYTAEAVLGGEITQIAQAFSVWRSRFSNRVLRGRLASVHNTSVVEVLEQAFARVDQSGVTGGPSLLAKNQLLYLLGRIDDSEETKGFLAGVWRDEQQHLFVRYSAAFAGVIAGDETVESEFVGELETDSELAALNRGHHLLYYGDVTSAQLPHFDDDVAPVEQAVSNLLRRLEEQEPHVRRVRRVELVTLRQFIESGRVTGSAIEKIPTVLDALEGELEGRDSPQEQGLAAELHRVRQVL